MDTDEPQCVVCRHFYVTWNAPRPKGCRAYGFESGAYPSVVVRRESGEPCKLFEAKPGTATSVTERVDARRSNRG